MKKFALFCSVALLLSTMSIGCSSTNGGSTSSWCRTGSLFPTASSRNAVQTVYAPALASNCNPCDATACSPCEPVCSTPCERVCNPCEPACDPCHNVFTRGMYPGPVQ